jgi:hypothetical protein
MKRHQLKKWVVFIAVMSGVTAIAVILNPPQSASHEEYAEWYETVIHGDTNDLSFAYREYVNEQPSIAYTLSGTASQAKIARLGQLAQEAQLFSTPPLTTLTPSPSSPITEVVIEGNGRRFAYRDLRSRFEQSLSARSLRKLAEIFGGSTNSAQENGGQKNSGQEN